LEQLNGKEVNVCVYNGTTEHIVLMSEGERQRYLKPMIGWSEWGTQFRVKFSTSVVDYTVYIQSGPIVIRK